MVYYTTLALWKNCPRETEPDVLRYLERAGKALLNYEGADFVELLTRVLDYPRRDIIDPSNPDFAQLVNSRIAQSCGAKRHLRPEAFYGLGFPRFPAKIGKRTQRSYTKTQTTGDTKERILEAKSTPLDGSKEQYADGPFGDPKKKVEISFTCYCWNGGLPCKVLNEKGQCRKLHICSHNDCRTLFHHGHRRRDHQQKSD